MSKPQPKVWSKAVFFHQLFYTVIFTLFVGCGGFDRVLIADVNVADTNLADCINQAAQKSNWLYTDEVTELSCVEKKISSLEGMQAFSNSPLETLDLSWNNFSALGPLAGITSLKSLTLSNNYVSDVSPLAKLTNLTELRLGNKAPHVSSL